MFDLQAVYIRDVAEITKLDLVSVASLSGEDTTGITEVFLNGREAKFMALDHDKLLVLFPSDLFFDAISSMKLTRVTLDASGAGVSGTENIDPNRLTLNNSILNIFGYDFAEVVEVLVNNKSVPFATLSTQNVYATLPEKDTTLEDVRVIRASTTIGGRSFFSFLIGEHPRLTSGPAKLTYQFVKVLMTSTGTDLLRPEIGGNMQNWVGQKISSANTQALVAQTVLAVSRAAAYMSSYQLSSKLPASEKLATVQVLDASLDPSDPTSMRLSIKLVSQAQQSAVFGLLLGSLDKLTQAGT